MEIPVMNVIISGKVPDLKPALRDSVEKKITDALDRFQNRIKEVRVFLADVNGPKKGVDKTLRVVVDFVRQPLIIVEERGESWTAMIDHSVDRVVRSVSRQVKRVRSRSGRTSMAGEGIVSDDDSSR
jgi:ribosome-associated translation inhibitor RaiA